MFNKQIQRVIKQAYWQVLINCPQDDPDYKRSKHKITQIMSVFFIHEKRLSPDILKGIIEYIDLLSQKSFGRLFSDCSDELMDELLYLGFQKYLTADDLSSFYNEVLEEKPKIWCEGCRRFSINTEC